MKNEIIALILAGGKGSRLGKLTQDIAKPAVPFGGKYRIIDFPLSNCSNSGINTVGVMTQYEPFTLNEHIGGGESWGLDIKDGGASILQPYTSNEGEKWFKGTANSVFQNISFIDLKHPKYVLILSGDHIYKMDYRMMLETHKKNNADCTIAVIPVPLEEASRFGIMNTNNDGQIIEFEEKPAKPKSNLASMGIYIFTWEKLREYLRKAPDALGDFGKDVIPTYLRNGERLYAYKYEGYWKDVGTINSLWEANMEFLDPNHPLKIRDYEWQIFSKNVVSPPLFIHHNAKVNNSIITDGAIIRGDILHSVISGDVYVGENSIIKDSVIMAGTKIGSGAFVEYAIIGENASVADNAKIRGTPDNILVIGYEESVGGEYHEKA